MGRVRGVLCSCIPYYQPNIGYLGNHMSPRGWCESVCLFVSVCHRGFIAPKIAEREQGQSEHFLAIGLGYTRTETQFTKHLDEDKEGLEASPFFLSSQVTLSLLSSISWDRTQSLPSLQVIQYHIWSLSWMKGSRFHWIKLSINQCDLMSMALLALEEDWISSITALLACPVFKDFFFLLLSLTPFHELLLRKVIAASSRTCHLSYTNLLFMEPDAWSHVRSLRPETL